MVTLRWPARPHRGHRASTPLELIFDLVSVVAVSAAAIAACHREPHYRRQTDLEKTYSSSGECICIPVRGGWLLPNRGLYQPIRSYISDDASTQSIRQVPRPSLAIAAALTAIERN